MIDSNGYFRSALKNLFDRIAAAWPRSSALNRYTVTISPCFGLNYKSPGQEEARADMKSQYGHARFIRRDERIGRLFDNVVMAGRFEVLEISAPAPIGGDEGATEG
jgi:hypothetical protein